MRQFTSVALSATYLCLALIVALLLWRNGGGWAAGVAALVGGLGLCLAIHGLVAQTLKLRSLRREFEDVREAHRIMLGQMEQLDGRLAEMAEAVNTDLGRSEAIEDELQMLEGLVEELGDRLD
ncbi:MAG TPA: diguanylate phosphodiesterase, partial [Phenylobacterium sp.]